MCLTLCLAIMDEDEEALGFSFKEKNELCIFTIS